MKATVPPGSQVAQSIAETGIGFMFAPAHHPAMKNVGPTRVELGTRTIFNLLGPLSNPAGVRRQMIGVFSKHWTEPLAQVIGERVTLTGTNWVNLRRPQIILSTVQAFFDERRVDIMPRVGKSGGAFAMGVSPDVPPFLLLNYTGLNYWAALIVAPVTLLAAACSSGSSG